VSGDLSAWDDLFSLLFLLLRCTGDIEEAPTTFKLDDQNEFAAGKETAVSSNTFNILKHSRLAPHFEFFGDESDHKGTFPVAPRRFPHFTSTEASAGGKAGCCPPAKGGQSCC
jgi:hypothetical protein